ncbi:MAG: GTPase Era [Spirochaeta sp. LUC14_002_19_P3]|nr:MAG: GTPase Era [Spirochaeta sp. LUC14_002_19_P3]
MKCGFVAIIGRPSAGKSSLLNAICGEKTAITSPIPQTTRNAVRGIVNTPAGQIIFLDTPGYHLSDKKINGYFKDSVLRSINEADAVLYVIDASRLPGREEFAVMELIKKTRLPIAVAVNKTDLQPPHLAEIRGLILARLQPAALINVSALQSLNIRELRDAIMELCPEGLPHYPPDCYTDQTPEFRMAEIIREQAIARCGQEIPHALYVDIADMEFTPSHGGNESMEYPLAAPELSPKKLWVRAFIMVERSSQAGILVGHRGERIREIRIASLRAMKKIFPWKITLDLRVKVHPKWRKKDPLLKQMYGAED